MNRKMKNELIAEFKDLLKSAIDNDSYASIVKYARFIEYLNDEKTVADKSVAKKAKADKPTKAAKAKKVTKAKKTAKPAKAKIKPAKAAKPKKSTGKKRLGPAPKQHFPAKTVIVAKYKGKEYKALALDNGAMEYKRKKYASLFSMGKAIMGRAGYLGNAVAWSASK